MSNPEYKQRVRVDAVNRSHSSQWAGSHLAPSSSISKCVPKAKNRQRLFLCEQGTCVYPDALFSPKISSTPVFFFIWKFEIKFSLHHVCTEVKKTSHFFKCQTKCQVYLKQTQINWQLCVCGTWWRLNGRGSETSESRAPQSVLPQLGSLCWCQWKRKSPDTKLSLLDWQKKNPTNKQNRMCMHCCVHEVKRCSAACEWEIPLLLSNCDYVMRRKMDWSLNSWPGSFFF